MTWRAIGSAVVGVLLVLLALVLAFWRPQVSRALVELDPMWLGITSWAGLRFVGWAALAGGAWLLAAAWQQWRGEPDEQPTTSPA